MSSDAEGCGTQIRFNHLSIIVCSVKVSGVEMISFISKGPRVNFGFSVLKIEFNSKVSLLVEKGPEFSNSRVNFDFSVFKIGILLFLTKGQEIFDSEVSFDFSIFELKFVSVSGITFDFSILEMKFISGSRINLGFSIFKIKLVSDSGVDFDF